MSGMPDHHLAAPHPKKPRIEINPSQQYNINQWTPLKVDVNAAQAHAHAKSKGCTDAQSSYLPETEAISPTLPNESLDSKSEIVTSISQVDKEIAMVEVNIKQLENEQMKLEREAAKPKDASSSNDGEKTTESRPLTLTQLVYKENKESAAFTHNLLFEKFGDPTGFGIPLYNQPTDTPVYEKNRKHFTTFRAVLCQHFKRRAAERQRTERYLAETYQRLLTDWLKKVESEKTAKLALKDQKSREMFEKIFPEIKKVREDREKFQSRVGARGGGSGFARTEAEFDQIMEGINEKEQEERKMKAYAIIPQLLPTTEKHYKYMNENGLIHEPVTLYKERKESRFWSQEEKDLFKEKYLERPKQFSHICEAFDKKSLNDCVLYYYMSKKSENYKQLLKKHMNKRLPKKNRIRHGPTITENINPRARGQVSDEEEMEFTRPAVFDPTSVCACCNIKLEPGATSYQLIREQCNIYGLQEKDYQINWRVCDTCKMRRDRIRNPICPVPTCNSVRRCKLRSLPPSWFEVTAELRDMAMKQLEITVDIAQCCTKCYNKICQLINTPQHIIFKQAEWTETEIALIQAAIRTHGTNWNQVSSMVSNRTVKQCKKLFIRHKKQYSLDAVLHEYKTRRAAELGRPISDNEDDLLEDNDFSSDDNMDLSPPATSESHSLINSDEILKRKDETAVKSELPERMDVTVKEEKEEDSSATASADEGPDIKPIPPKELVAKIKSEPLYGATDFSNSSPYASSWRPQPHTQNDSIRMSTDQPFSSHLTTSIASYLSTNSRSSPLRTASQTTSVKELIDHTIEDALNNQPSELTTPSRRQSVINPPRSQPSSTSVNTGIQRQWSPSPHSLYSITNNTSTSTTSVSHPSPNNIRHPDSNSQSQAARSLPPPPVKREYNMTEGLGHMPGMSPYSDMTRQPPPAHSNKAGKSSLPSMYMDNVPFNTNQRPAHSDIKPISQSQPLELKKEPHSDSSRHMKFEGGSISHGTPRSQHELNALSALTAVSQATERLSPRPARPAVSNSPARAAISEFDRRLAEQQQQQLLQLHLLQMQAAGLFPPTSFPGFMPPDFSSNNVLKDDFRTAHPELAHHVPGSNALDKLSSRTKDLLPNTAAGFPALDPRMRDYMNSAAAGIRLPNPITSQSNKADDLQRNWPPRSTPSHNGPTHHNMSADASRLAHPSRPSLLSAVSKTLSPYPSHMNDRHHQVQQQHREPSNSPHRSRYEMTKFEKDVSEVNKMASGSERSRYEADQHSLPESESRSAHYPSPHSSIPVSMRDDIRSANPADHRPRSTDYHITNLSHRQDHHTREQNSNRDHREPHDNSQFHRDHTTSLPNPHPPSREHTHSNMSNRNHHTTGLANRDHHTAGLANRDHHTAGLNRDSQSRENQMASLNVKHNDRRSLLEEDRKLMQSKQKVEQPERPHHQQDTRHRLHQSENRTAESHQSESARLGGVHQSEASRHFSSKKLAEVEKAFRKEHLHNDASAFFSSSFEKDPHEQNLFRKTDTREALTAAGLIDAIITQQITSESAPSNQQHKSVIVPLKKQRMTGSSSETDLTQLQSERRSENRPITLADRISDLINEGYAQPNKGDSTPKSTDGHSSSPHRAYRVDDVEPISPPSKNDSSNNSSTRQSPKSSHHAHSQPQKKNIRSLLGAGSPHTNSEPARTTHEPANNQLLISPMDYVKNKIEEAIRQGFDKDPPPQKLPDKFNNTQPGYHKPGDGYNSSNQSGAKPGPHSHIHQHRPVNRHNELDKPAKRTVQSGLEAMLRPPKPTHSHRAKSPEEVDLYNRIHSKQTNMRPGASPKPTTSERMKTPPSAGDQLNRPPSLGHTQRSTTPKISHPNDSRQSPIDNSHRYSPLTQNLPDYRPTGLLKSLNRKNMYEPKHKHENSTGRSVLSSKYETLSDEDS